MLLKHSSVLVEEFLLSVSMNKAVKLIWISLIRNASVYRMLACRSPEQSKCSEPCLHWWEAAL